MTKRYYYTDPLAAAWMLKHFNLRIHIGGGDMCVITVDFPLNRYGEDFTSVEKKLYIPPDSEHILNPQVGDLVKITHSKGRVYTDNVNYQEMDTMIFIGHYPYQRTDALCNGIVETEIIQRNKTAFMWPEVEEINNEL